MKEKKRNTKKRDELTGTDADEMAGGVGPEPSSADEAGELEASALGRGECSADAEEESAVEGSATKSGLEKKKGGNPKPQASWTLKG